VEGSSVDDETYRYIQAVEKRMEDLRVSDREAVSLAHADLSQRLEGFPQQFATKDEIESIRGVVQRLEKEGVTREIYETNHKALNDLVNRLDREKMPEATFKAFVDNYRIHSDEAAVERRAVAAALAASQERGVALAEGAQSSWKQIGVIIGLVAFVISTIVVIANQFLPA
jgi:hypothetical protein